MVAVIAVIGIIIAYTVIRFVTVGGKSKSNQPPGPLEPPKPVYETTIGDIKFYFQSAEDLGNTLKSTVQYQSDLTTTERFVRVVVGAQNKGKVNAPQYSWDAGNVVDSEGRNYENINNKAYNFLPKPDLCGAVLKPEFDPVPCVKLYEVSKQSQGLKVTVRTTQLKKQEAVIDVSFGEGG